VTRLGEKIKELRLEKKLTLSKLAEIAKVGQSTINDIESGKAKNPKTDTLVKLADALSVSVNELILENWDDVYNENDKLKNEVELLESIQKTYGKQSVQLLEDFFKLNSNGQKEANKRVAELAEINKYIKNTSDEISCTKDNVIQLNSKESEEVEEKFIPYNSLDEAGTTIAAHDDDLTDEEKERADKILLDYINNERLKEFNNKHNIK